MTIIETDRRTLRMLAGRAGGSPAENEVSTVDKIRVSDLARRIVAAADRGPIAVEVEN